MEIRRLILEFPEGLDPKLAGRIACEAQEISEQSCRCGGYTMLYMPMTKEDEEKRGMEFSEDEMTFEYNKRIKK